MPAFHIPGYNYCGPGTHDFTVAPTNNLDAACREHDISYDSKYVNKGIESVNPYFNFTQGDQDLINKASEEGGLSGRFIAGFFGAKKYFTSPAFEKTDRIR